MLLLLRIKKAAFQKSDLLYSLGRDTLGVR